MRRREFGESEETIKPKERMQTIGEICYSDCERVNNKMDGRAQDGAHTPPNTFYQFLRLFSSE